MNKILKNDIIILIEKYKKQSKEIQDFVLNPICIITKADLLKQEQNEKKICKKYNVSSELELLEIRANLDISVFELNMILEKDIINY